MTSPPHPRTAPDRDGRRFASAARRSTHGWRADVCLVAIGVEEGLRILIVEAGLLMA
jgi:hypothetical protein